MTSGVPSISPRLRQASRPGKDQGHGVRRGLLALEVLVVVALNGAVGRLVLEASLAAR